MKFTYSVLISFALMFACNCASISNYEISERNMNARDLVNGLANDNAGLDFDVSSRDRVGISSSGLNFFSGIDSNKRAVVDGITHGNEKLKVEENRVNKIMHNPFSIITPKIVDHVSSFFENRQSTTSAPHIAFIDAIGYGGPYKYENSKSTSLQVGDQKIEHRNDDILGKILVSAANMHLNNNRPFFLG